jgi:hypothetical protein
MRTQIPEMTGERLTARMSVWMLSAAQGNEQPIDRLETTIEVLRMVGFNQDIISDLVSKAANAASLPVKDAIERFAPVPEEKAKRQRGRKPAASA